MNLDSFPPQLRTLPQWVGYMLLEDPAKAKPSKVPINPQTHNGASSKNPSTWGGLAEAQAIVGQIGHCDKGDATICGVGFVFAEGGGIVGVDLDNCFQGGQLDSWAAAWVERFNSYTEVSPSGTGLHILCLGALPGKGVHKAKGEIYDQGRYFTVTGDSYGPPRPLQPAQEAIDALYKELTTRPVPEVETPTRGERKPVGLSDDELRARAMRSQHRSRRPDGSEGATFAELWAGDISRYPSASEADAALCNMLAFWTNCDAERMDRFFRQSALYRPKWDEVHGADTYGGLTINDAISTMTGPGYDPALYRQQSAAQDFAPEDEPISAAELMKKQFSPLVQPVAGLICEGVTLLVAASKIGKSWLALLMAICIANGSDFLGRHTTKSRVLYLALEDSERRLKERIRALGEPVPENLYLKTNITKMGEGFEEYIENWLQQDTSVPSVVIVDTLQKVRGIDGAGKNLYQTEYDVIGRIKKILDKYRASGICLHHNNKTKQVTDPYDKISGSNALMGAADTTILITRDRGQDTATVMFTGRDVWGDDFTIRFDNGRWSLVSDNAAEYTARQKYEQEPLVQLFRLLLQETPTGGKWTYKQLIELGVDKLGYEPFSSGKECGAKLRKGLAANLLARDGIRVEWAIKTATGNGVEIHRKG